MTVLAPLTTPLGTCPACGATGTAPCGHFTGRDCFEPDGPRLHNDGQPWIHGCRPKERETPMTAKPTTRPQTFAAAIAALPAELVTDKMTVAVKQRWTVAPGTSPELRKQLAAVEAKPTPTASELHADPAFRSDLERGPAGAADEPRMEAATAEAKRLAGNAKVNAWRERSRLQATIDLRAVQMKARTGKIKVTAVSHDAVDPADAAEAADSAADVTA